MNAPAGTQSIIRTINILKAVADRREIGWRLTDLAAHCGLGKSTTYRIVACLCSERMLQQRPDDRRYIPGQLLYELALALPSYAAFKDAAHPGLEQLSKRLGGIAFLYLRSGEEAVCIDRVGDAAVPAITGVGTRRLLSESTFGISMLFAMPRQERELLLAANRRDPHAAKGERAAAYRRILQRSRRCGFGLNEGDITQGTTGIAVPVVDRFKRPIASIGVMVPSEKCGADRRPRVLALLRETALALAADSAFSVAAT
ncbi:MULTISPECIES: IclR family transcriptional regulator [unclassified Pigmentiphaga]|uniref:IclR family transcriptional regulator n=1 Tax=unclassified Pigmentiphaga TaxID=2626614 RepID=UPI000B40F27D|nr:MULTISPECIES: IclR family transcriptional regulator [unclassified Pigmentiphaga]OVZ66440.1 hypothetical protein CDO46_00745 [Pigmentiphaga sp. NML030171]